MSTRFAKTIVLDDGGEYSLAVRTRAVDPENDEPIETIIYEGSIDEDGARTVVLAREDALALVRFLADELGLHIPGFTEPARAS